MDIKTQFGIKVKQIRLQNSLSQEQLANLSGLHRTYISSVELGGRNISIVNIQKIANALKKPISFFFE